MTPALRKRHQRIWWFLGLALLIIWGTSMMAIEKNNSQQIPMANANSLAKGVTVKLISNDMTDSQLIKLTVNEPLASPQTLVYLASGEKTLTQNRLFLGRIDGTGTYEFSFNVPISSLTDKVIKGFDGIHQKELFTAAINTN